MEKKETIIIRNNKRKIILFKNNYVLYIDLNPQKYIT